MNLPTGIVEARPVDTDGGQSLNQFVGYLRQNQWRQQQLAREDDYRKAEIMKSINPSILSERFEPEVVNATMKELQEFTSNALRSGVSEAELQNQINSKVASIAAWNGKVKAIKNVIQKQFQAMGDQPAYNKETWYADALHSAIYNPDGSMKSAEKIDPSIDYVKSSFDANRTKYVNYAPTMKSLEGELQKGDDNEITTSNSWEKGLQSGKKTFSVKYKDFQTLDPKTGKLVLKTDPKTGLISEDIYGKYIKPDSSYDDMLTARAQQLAPQTGVDPNDHGNIELLKRGIFTKMLEGHNYQNIKDITASGEKQPHVGLTINMPNSEKGVHPLTRADMAMKGQAGVPVQDRPGRYDITEDYSALPLAKTERFGKEKRVTATRVIYDKSQNKFFVFDSKLNHKEYSPESFKDLIRSVPGMENYVDPKHYNTDPEPESKPVLFNMK